MTGAEYAVMMYEDGQRDGRMHLPSKYADEPEYSIGYAFGEKEDITWTQ